MNKRISLFIFIFLLSFSFVCAQDNPSEKKVLAEKSHTLFQQGKYVDAIDMGEKVVEIEKNSNPVNNASYAISLVNLARMKSRYFLLLTDGLENRKIDPRAISSASEQRSKTAKEADSLFRQALQLKESLGQMQTTQTADIKNDLAWLTYNYSGSRQSIDEAEKLFLESLALNESLRGAEAEETLAVVLNIGNFYYEFSNFEKALSYFDRYLQTAEKTPDQNSTSLVVALRSRAAILFATFQDQDAAAVVKKIESITKKSEEMPKDDLRLHLRSKNSVAMSMKILGAYNEDRKEFKDRAKLESLTLSGTKKSESPKMERVLVKVEVDESGKVVKAKAETDNEKLGRKAEEEISKWMVRPFSSNGVAHRMRGYLYYFEPR